jgi:hypothetical protein
MNHDDQLKLAAKLLEFFQEHDIKQRNFLCQNVVGRVLKQELKKNGFWKNRKRGKPMLKKQKKIEDQPPF